MKIVQSVFMLVVMSVTVPVLAQETTKTCCLSSLGYQGSIDSLKAELLTAAKREAVREFFGEFISSFTKVENLRITEDTIQATSLGFVRIKGDPEYYQGPNLGEVCVKIAAYTTPEDFEKFKPLTLTQKSCITEGDVKTIKQDTEKKAILDALINYDRRLETSPPEQVLPLLREVSFSDEGFVPDTQVYCAKATGSMYPVEVLGTLMALEGPAAQRKTDYVLDLTKYAVGDLPDELGCNLLIGEEDRKKYIRPNTDDSPGEIEIHDLWLSENFECIIAGWWATAQILIVSDIGEEITIKNGEKSCSFITFGSMRKEWGTCGMYYTRRVFKLVINGEKATLFVNDDLFGTILVKPVVYHTVLVKGLGRKERVYGLSVRKP